MRRPWARAFAAILLLGACSGDGCLGPSGKVSCTPDFGDGGLDDQECTSRGGVCGALFGCGADEHAIVSGGCFGGACCAPGVACAQNGGLCVPDGDCPSSAASVSGFCTTGQCCEASFVRDSGPDAQAIGSCDGFACAAGCACEPGPPDAGTRGVCDCGGLDGGTDAGGDAGDAALPDAAADASSDAFTDAPSDAADDAPNDAASDADSGGGAAVEPCGVITCRGGCICTSPTDSACICP
jgi:hypothetical protein